MITPEHLAELSALCSEVKELSEGGRTFIYIPKLRFPSGGQLVEVEALLCPQEHNGYATRLFLSQGVPGRGANWSSHHILGRTWYTWSWNGISAQLRPAEILAEHLRALR